MPLQLLDAGEIVNTHGIHGEVKINPWADNPDFLMGFDTFYLDGQPTKVASARVHKGCVLAKLCGVDGVEDAAKLRGKIVQIDRAGLTLDGGAVFIADLIGLPVYAGQQLLGKLTDVLTLPANDVYVVQGQREYMIPAVREFLEEINVREGFLRVKLLEGMATDEN